MREITIGNIFHFRRQYEEICHDGGVRDFGDVDGNGGTGSYVMAFDDLIPLLTGIKFSRKKLNQIVSDMKAGLNDYSDPMFVCLSTLGETPKSSKGYHYGYKVTKPSGETVRTNGQKFKRGGIAIAEMFLAGGKSDIGTWKVEFYKRKRPTDSDWRSYKAERDDGPKIEAETVNLISPNNRDRQ